METTTKTLDFLKSLKGKKIRISVGFNITYITDNLDLYDNLTVVFSDKFGYRVMLSISQITRVEEIR